MLLSLGEFVALCFFSYSHDDISPLYLMLKRKRMVFFNEFWADGRTKEEKSPISVFFRSNTNLSLTKQSLYSKPDFNPKPKPNYKPKPPSNLSPTSNLIVHPNPNPNASCVLT